MSPQQLKRVTTTASSSSSSSTSGEVPRPLQQLCNIIKAIAASSSDSQDKPLVDKGEATALALAVAKLMKFKPIRLESNVVEDAGELVSKHLDSDFSCFLCRKKCRTKARFFLHFKRHFSRRAAKNQRCESSGSSSSDDMENEDLRPRRKSVKNLPHRRRLTNVDQDGDSGCHSAGVDGSSSNGELTSDCPGDSESSDSESEVQKSIKLDKLAHRNAGAIKSMNTSANKLSLAEKQLDNNETEGLVCMTCLKRFSNCQNLRRHLRLHIARDSIKPDIQEPETQPAAFDDGVEAARQGRYLCDWCPARFDNRSAARIHESTHRGQEPKCYVCSKQYADRYSLRYHLRTHGIGRQIRCEFCSKAFSKPSRLAAHVRSHHKNIRDFACPSCDKAFKTRVHLNNHFRQHSGEKPFQCGVCHERFRHKASMISHCRKHDGERPYCCEICGKTFREPSTLKAHSRVHSGDKPYVCQECGKSFTQRAGLNYHKRASHENIRPHACRFCPFATVKAASLAAHYRNIHQQQHIEDTTTAASITAPPLPSFDNLKTSSAQGDSFSAPTAEGPATPPSSASPASSTSSTPRLEDFLPHEELEQSSAHQQQQQQPPTASSSSSDYPLPSLSMSELSPMDYYDYGNGNGGSNAGSSGNAGSNGYRNPYPQEHVMPHHHHTMHHHQQQQWFSYAAMSSQHHHHHLQMIHPGANNTSSSPSSSPPSSSTNYPYAGNNYSSTYFSSSSGDSSGGYHHQMGFPAGANYDSYAASAAVAAAVAAANNSSHPSYCI